MAASVLGLRTTIYKVGDINIAKGWYAEAFQVEPYFDEPFYVGFNVAGYELGLMEEDISAADKTTNVLRAPLKMPFSRTVGLESG